MYSAENPEGTGQVRQRSERSNKESERENRQQFDAEKVANIKVPEDEQDFRLAAKRSQKKASVVKVKE